MIKKDVSTGFKISLLSVASGNKERIVNELSDAIKKSTGSDPVAILKLFGRYDLCAIYKTDNYLSGPSRKGWWFCCKITRIGRASHVFSSSCRKLVHRLGFAAGI